MVGGPRWVAAAFAGPRGEEDARIVPVLHREDSAVEDVFLAVSPDFHFTSIHMYVLLTLEYTSWPQRHELQYLITHSSAENIKLHASFCA